MLIGKEKGIRTPEFHKKKEREKWIKVSAWVLLILIVIITPIYLLRNDHLLISAIEIKGNNVTKSTEIQEIMSKHLEGNYLWLIPRSSILLYPRKQIERELLASIPRFSKVDIELLDIRSLVVSVTERDPKALYCRDTFAPTAPTDCYFLDESGYIFSEAPAFSGGVYFVYSSSPVLESPLRHQFLDKEAFSILPPFIESLSRIGVYPKVLVEKGEEYHLVLANGGTIMWKKSERLEDIYSNLDSFISSNNLKNQQKTLDDILYLDLRFGNKIFYKFRDEI